MDIISSQAIFHMCPAGILLYKNKHSIIYYTYEIYNTDKRGVKFKTMRTARFCSFCKWSIFIQKLIPRHYKTIIYNTRLEYSIVNTVEIVAR